MANPTSTRRDPLPVFCFLVRFTNLPGNVETYFKSVSGIRYETESVPVRAGGANDTTFNLVGATKWSPLVFKQGFTNSSGLLAWREQWMSQRPGNMTRTGGSIIQLNTALQPSAQWNFVNGWPSKWEIGEFAADKNELAIETLEICHDGIKYVKLGATQ
jgi:phage tail-like protein